MEYNEEHLAADEVQQHILKARDNQKRAEHVVNEVADTLQTPLERPPVEELKQELHDAEQTVAIAESEQKAATQQLTKERLKQIHETGPTIAGYKPVELLKAFAKPPEPAHELPGDAAMEKDVRKDLEQSARNVKKKVKNTKYHVKKVLGDIEEIEKNSTSASTTMNGSQHFKAIHVYPVAFISVGVFCFLLGTILVFNTRNTIGVLAICIGIGEILTGFVLRKLTD